MSTIGDRPTSRSEPVADPVRPYVLVVDDNEEIRDLLALVLEEEGYRVRTAAGGEEAVQVSRAERPDLITLDLSLPGMDGWAVLRELQAHRETTAIPVLIISAFTRHLETPAREHVARVIPKPFYLDQIVSEVQAALATRTAPDTPRGDPAPGAGAEGPAPARGTSADPGRLESPPDRPDG